MKTKLFQILILLLPALSVKAAPPDDGKTIFSARCASCHALNKILTGPALSGVDKRHSIDWIVKFVQSSQTLIKSGDKDAVALFEKFNKVPMPDHSDLSAEQIKSVVAYVVSQGGTEKTKAPFAKPAKLRPAYTPASFANAKFFVGYGVIVALLILSLLFAVQVKEYERKLNHEQ